MSVRDTTQLEGRNTVLLGRPWFRRSAAQLTAWQALQTGRSFISVCFERASSAAHPMVRSVSVPALSPDQVPDLAGDERVDEVSRSWPDNRWDRR